MKTIITAIGVILILFGIVTLAYRGYTYTTQQKVMQIGNVEVTANNEKRIYFPPMLGGLSLAAGIILVIAGRLGK